MFIWVDLDSREISSTTMLPMCSDIFIRSTIYLLGVLGETDGVIYISTLCQYLDTDCDQVYRDEQGGCKICVHPSKGCYTRYSYWNLSDNLKGWHFLTGKNENLSTKSNQLRFFKTSCPRNCASTFVFLNCKDMSLESSFSGPQRITLVSCRSFSVATSLNNEAMPLPTKEKVILVQRVVPMVPQRSIQSICIYTSRCTLRRSHG